MKKEIKHTWHFAQSPAEVWDYLTKPELLEQWLMKSDFQPIVGHQFRFIGGCDHSDDTKAAAYCEVLEVKPFTTLSYSWQANSANTTTPFQSKVVWTLLPNENGTDLQLVHGGFTVLEDYLAHDEGWTRIGNKMVEFLNAIAQ